MDTSLIVSIVSFGSTFVAFLVFCIKRFKRCKCCGIECECKGGEPVPVNITNSPAPPEFNSSPV